MNRFWVTLRTEPELWTVGHYDGDGKFQPDSDHGSAQEAAERIHYLNGGEAATARRRDYTRISLALDRLLAHAGLDPVTDADVDAALDAGR